MKKQLFRLIATTIISLNLQAGPTTSVMREISRMEQQPKEESRLKETLNPEFQRINKLLRNNNYSPFDEKMFTVLCNPYKGDNPYEIEGHNHYRSHSPFGTETFTYENSPKFNGLTCKNYSDARREVQNGTISCTINLNNSSNFITIKEY